MYEQDFFVPAWEFLDKIIWRRFKIHEIVLYTEKFWNWLENEHREEMDNLIKDFICSIMKINREMLENQR
ncbi:unnamed protein product [Blepharisma stoltei]|uniref:Uncharacterized protein n=1 Tax=Blepharisma stoltei TaxID=1481888 RepID=A0AAU9KAD4_9CILI|nr:unnamed protein product [Blepharisma stoltei]